MRVKRQDDRKLKLLLVGPYPPPYGGIAMTIFDLRRYLLRQQVGEVIVLNIGEGRQAKSQEFTPVQGELDYLLQVAKFAWRGYTIHLETNGHNFKSWLSALVCVLVGLLNGRKTVIAFGSGNLPVYIRDVNGWERLVVVVVMRWAGIVICRNESMVEALRSVGMKTSRIEVVPGFMGLADRQIGEVPQLVKVFCATHAPVLGATVNLEPEYGVPLILEALGLLRERYPKIGLVFIGIGREAEDLILADVGLRECVLLAGILSPDVTLGVMALLSVFVRPTYFEGDSVSVREALALGIPVVASDAGFRPDGVRQFKVGDCSDLCRQLNEILRQTDKKAQVHREWHFESGNASRMLNLYYTLD
jgi:glycogen(starch) synthase